MTVPYLSQLSFFPKRQWFKICSKHNVNDGWYLTAAIVYPNRILCAGRSEQSLWASVVFWAEASFVHSVHLDHQGVFQWCSFSVGSLGTGSSKKKSSDTKFWPPCKSFVAQNKPMEGLMLLMKPDDKITLKTIFPWFGIKFLHTKTLYSICVLC